MAGRVGRGGHHFLLPQHPRPGLLAAELGALQQGWGLPNSGRLAGSQGPLWVQGGGASQTRRLLDAHPPS